MKHFFITTFMLLFFKLYGQKPSDLLSLGEFVSYIDNPKALGVNIKIKPPLAFEKLEGDRPGVVAKFNNQEHNLTYVLSVYENPTFLNRQDLIDSFGESETYEFAKEQAEAAGAHLISSKFTKVDRYPTIEAVLDFSNEMILGQNIEMRCVSWTIFYEDRILGLFAGSLRDKFEIYKHIFQKITNSVLFEDQYEIPGVTNKKTVNENLELYVDKFYRDLAYYGISVVRNDKISVKLMELDLFENSKHVHGISYGYNDDSKIDIVINKRSWYSFTKAQKHYLIYHELLHDVLNIDDETIYSEENNIMYPSIDNFKSLNMDDFALSLQVILENYTIKKE